MTVGALLAELRRRDIGVRLDGEDLRFSAPAGALTAELTADLRQRKREIVDLLRSLESAGSQARAVVPLQPHGTRTPIFGVPGHNGDVFCYRTLARRLGNDQPFFGLQPPGSDGHAEPLRDTVELAAYFAEQLRLFRPEGPVILAGFCAGGAVAFELARQLQQGGTVVEFVAMFTAPYPGRLPALADLPRLGRRTAASPHCRTGGAPLACAGALPRRSLARPPRAPQRRARRTGGSGDDQARPCGARHRRRAPRLHAAALRGATTVVHPRRRATLPEPHHVAVAPHGRRHARVPGSRRRDRRRDAPRTSSGLHRAQLRALSRRLRRRHSRYRRCHVEKHSSAQSTPSRFCRLVRCSRRSRSTAAGSK